MHSELRARCGTSAGGCRISDPAARAPPTEWVHQPRASHGHGTCRRGRPHTRPNLPAPAPVHRARSRPRGSSLRIGSDPVLRGPDLRTRRLLCRIRHSSRSREMLRGQRQSARAARIVPIRQPAGLPDRCSPRSARTHGPTAPRAGHPSEHMSYPSRRAGIAVMSPSRVNAVSQQSVAPSLGWPCLPAGQVCGPPRTCRSLP